MIKTSHLVLALMLTAQPQTIRPTFERLAREITLLGPDEFIYGFRDSRRIPAEELRHVREFTDLLENGTWKAPDFLPLLTHEDPKVRTLAMIALYSLDDPKVLPEIFSLVKDQSNTFRAVRHFASILTTNALPPSMTEPQTVGQIATGILDVYMKSGGFFYGPLGNGGEPGFPEYWKTHAGRLSSAGWWSVRLARAGHSTSPTPLDRYPAIRKLRAELDKLPEPDRTLTLLRLIDETGVDVLVSREELAALLKGLGPDTILDVLKRKIPSDDPDLQPSRGLSPGMRLFILQNSSTLLRAGDSTALLDQEVWERDFQKHGVIDPLIDPWWAIGAAQLDRAEAASILEQAYPRFQGQYDSRHQLELAHALWRLAGEDHAATVADWIYGELARPMGQESNILDATLKTDGRRNTVLARTLIEDPRFDELNWKSLEVLSKAVNSWTGRQVVSAKEMESAWSPIGIDFFMLDKPRALNQYPKEIGELTGTLSRWRQSLRASVPVLRALP